MALTLTEGAKLSNDVLLEGVIETVISESPVLQRLPFIEIVATDRDIAAASMVAGRRVAVALFDAANPLDAMILGVF
ncbi:MAG: hypothetical protein U0360_07660 [Dehalococcoidia bacterium]